MVNLPRILGLLAAGLGILTLVPPQRRQLSGPMFISKRLAEALVPLLALVGTLGALLGVVYDDLVAVCTGLVGAVISAWHLFKMTAPHERADFDRIFGPDWQARIPDSLRSHMLKRRYTPLLVSTSSPHWQRDVCFGEHLRCDVWEPPTGVPRTGLAVVYLFGGGWHYMDKDLGTRRLFRHLAGQGHVIMDAAYTLAPRAQLVRQIGDVKRAIAWLKSSADRYGVNPERLVLMGCSSGAHLALLAAYTPNHPRLQPTDISVDTSVRAVVSYSGMPDLLASYAYFQDHLGRFLSDKIPLGRWTIAAIEAIFQRTRYLPAGGQYVDAADWIPSLLGGTPDEALDMYRLASPIHHVGPHCPPTLLLQGEHDFTGITPDVRRLHRALGDNGVPSIYVEFPNTEHAFDMVPANLPGWLPAAQAAAYVTERFLAMMI